MITIFIACKTRHLKCPADHRGQRNMCRSTLPATLFTIMGVNYMLCLSYTCFMPKYRTLCRRVFFHRHSLVLHRHPSNCIQRVQSRELLGMASFWQFFGACCLLSGSQVHPMVLNWEVAEFDPNNYQPHLGAPNRACLFPTRCPGITNLTLKSPPHSGTTTQTRLNGVMSDTMPSNALHAQSQTAHQGSTNKVGRSSVDSGCLLALTVAVSLHL